MIYVDNCRINPLVLADSADELVPFLPLAVYDDHVPRVIAITPRDRLHLLEAGAVPITWRQAGLMHKRLCVTGSLGRPEDVENWVLAQQAKSRIPPEEALW